jgi:hypothetical protein
MSLVSDLDFGLFDLDTVTYQASLGSPFLSLSGLSLSLAPRFSGGKIVVLEYL